MIHRYRARILGVAEPETIAAEVDLGFGVFVRKQFDLLGLREHAVGGKPWHGCRAWMDQHLLGRSVVIESHRRSEHSFVAVVFGCEDVNCRWTWAESLNAVLADHCKGAAEAQEELK